MYLDRDPYPAVERGKFFWGDGAAQCKVYGEFGISHAKIAELINMPFGVVSGVGQRNCVLDGAEIPHGKGEFWGLCPLISIVFSNAFYRSKTFVLLLKCNNEFEMFAARDRAYHCNASCGNTSYMQDYTFPQHCCFHSFPTQNG